MPIAIPLVSVGGVGQRRLMPGDVLACNEKLTAGAITTAGAGTWTGAAIATGIINRTGPVGGYTDTTDTASAILSAIAGNAPAADVVRGTSFRMRFINTVAQAHTLAAGTGVVLGAGSTLNAAASTWRDYLFTVLSAGPVLTLSGTTVASSTTLAFALPSGMVALPIGPSPLADNIEPGQSVSGTGITAGTTVAALTMGQGGLTGIILSGTATASAVVPLSFGPTVQVDSLGSGTL